MTRDDVLSLFAGPDGEPSEDEYLAFHAQRIAYLVPLLDSFVTQASARLRSPARLLDVGPGHLTITMAKRFGERAMIDTLGFPGDAFTAHAGLPGLHIGFDLNDAQEPERWVPPRPYDIVVVAEVIEHLYTAPQLVLRFLATFLADDGILVLQTPNAAALSKRLRLLMGRNPFELIREARDNPGHFREYTAGELRSICREAGLQCEPVILIDYFSDIALERARTLVRERPLHGSAALARVAVTQMLEDHWPSIRPGIAIVARKCG